MITIPPDERLVYLAFKNVFRGPDAHMRNKTKINKKIEQHRNENEEIQALVQEHDNIQLKNTIKALLEAEIFESTLKAKIRFPELFDVSPAQSAERSISEAEAAKTEGEAIREVTADRQDESVSATLNGEVLATTDKRKDPALPIDLPLPKRLLPESFRTRSLYPLYMPTKGQRRLLSKVQDILEDSCYKFGEKVMVDELQKQDWDSADCVELNVWTWLFKSREGLFETTRVAAIGRPLPDFLDSVAQIRHTAVHRLPITAARVESLLADAETLATLLTDDACTRQLSRLRRETRSIIEEFARNKDFLELQYMEKRKEIAAKKAELDRIERAAWESMLEEDKQYQSLAGVHLEDIIEVPETALHSAVNSDVEDTSEEDTSVESEGEPDFCRVGESSRRPLSMHSTKQGTLSSPQ